MMRVNYVTRLLILALVLMMALSLSALAESCALCGKETGNENYLCANCLLGLLDEKDVSSGLEITGAEVGADGSVTLSWTDAAGNGPYSVYYELLDSAPVLFGWTAAQNVSGNAITLTQLVPDTNYIFKVVDASGNKAEYVFYAPAPENGNEIGAKLLLITKLRWGDQVGELPLSASEIMADNGSQHSLYLHLTYSMLKHTRNYAFSVTVEAPNGFAGVVFSGQITLNYGKSEVPAWGSIALDDYFSYLKRYYGGVPAGEYLVTLHFDGKPACTVPFTIYE